MHDFLSVSLCCGGILAHCFFQHCFSFIEIYGHLFMHSTIKFQLQHFSQVKIWTLTSPSIFFSLFSHSDWLLYKPIAVRETPSHYSSDSFLHRWVHGWLRDCKVPGSCGCKNKHKSSPLHQLVLCIIAKHLHIEFVCPKQIVPEVLWFVQNFANHFHFKEKFCFLLATHQNEPYLFNLFLNFTVKSLKCSSWPFCSFSEHCMNLLGCQLL